MGQYPTKTTYHFKGQKGCRKSCHRRRTDLCRDGEGGAGFRLQNAIIHLDVGGQVTWTHANSSLPLPLETSSHKFHFGAWTVIIDDFKVVQFYIKS